MKTLSERIRFLPASDDPLSADVFFIEGEKRTYVYDVGSCEAALQALHAQEKPLVVVLSHFHQDHTGNIKQLPVDELYVGSRTEKKIGMGTVVRDVVTIDDGVHLEIRHCPSPHANGSLILTVDNTYTLVGDLYYTRPGQVDRGLAMHMLSVLKTVDTKYIVTSHEDEKVHEKDALLRELRAFFNSEKGNQKN